MKKHIPLIILLILLASILCSCSNNMTNTTKFEEVALGKYHYEQLWLPEDVVSFLKNLDETKYEIMEITEDTHGYTVFYKDID